MAMSGDYGMPPTRAVTFIFPRLRAVVKMIGEPIQVGFNDWGYRTQEIRCMRWCRTCQTMQELFWRPTRNEWQCDVCGSAWSGLPLKRAKGDITIEYIPRVHGRVLARSFAIRTGCGCELRMGG